MSSRYSRESEEGSLRQGSFDFGSSDTSSETITDRGQSRRVLPTDSSTPLRFSAISKHSSVKGSPDDIEEWLRSLPPGLSVRRTQSPENKKPTQTKTIRGQRLAELSSSSDRLSYFWRTYQTSLLSKPETDDLTAELYSGTWPRSGTIVDGVAYRLPRSELHTRATGSGLWPTLTRDYRSRPGPYARRGENFNQRTYPTMRASEYKGTGPKGSPSQKHRLDRHYLDAVIEELDGDGGDYFLSPFWCAWFMGYPRGWDELSPLSREAFKVWRNRVLNLTLWDDDPADSGAIPRLVPAKDDPPFRADRLRALGDSQVPVCAAQAFILLAEMSLRERGVDA